MEGQQSSLLEKALPPSDINFFDNENTPECTIMKHILLKLIHCGAIVTKYITQCAEEDAVRLSNENVENAFFMPDIDTLVDQEEHRSLINQLFVAWKLFFLEHQPLMHEVHTKLLEDELVPGTNKPRKLRTTLGTSVFAEITRLFYLLHRPTILMELEVEHIALCVLQHPLWVSISTTFDISSQYEDKEKPDGIVESGLQLLRTMWERSIVNYKQSECVMLTFFLTQQLDQLRQECLDEFEMVFQALWYRVGVLIQRAWPSNEAECVLDEPSFSQQVEGMRVCNRDFYTFISFYLGAIMYRFHYYRLMKPFAMNPAMLPLAGLKESVGHWLKTIVSEMPEEAFCDMYGDICNVAYNFAGDRDWFRYKWPFKVYTVSIAIMELRPHLYRRYHSEDRTTKERCLATVQENYVSRLFLLKAVQVYIHTKSGGNHIEWHQRTVIRSDQINLCSYELMSNQCPLLVQVLSSFWAYDQKHVFITDSLYESIGIVLFLLRKSYADCFFGHCLTFFIDQALERVGQQNLAANDQEDLELDSAYQLIDQANSHFLL